MNARPLWHIAVAWALCMNVAPLRADSWNLPKTTTFWSPAHKARLIVVPGDWTASPRRSAEGHLQVRYAGGAWHDIWNRALVNDAAPVDVMVTDDGRSVVTLDDWFSTGTGSHAVVLYGPDGTVVRSFALDDFLPRQYIQALPHSVSSILWRDKPRLSSDRHSVVIPVAIPLGPCEMLGDAGYVDFRLRLWDGVMLQPPADVWSAALSSAAGHSNAVNAAACPKGSSEREQVRLLEHRK